MSNPILEVKGVTKQFHLGPVTVDALKGIDLTINKGEFVVIVGSSGCGKSTLMNILGLLDKATSGTYHIRNREVSDFSDNELSKLRNEEIGFVFQSYNLLPRLDVLENVAIPLLYRGWNESDIRARGREMLARVEMDEREDHTPNELSGGQQQRVAVARALAGAPSIILADEPTGALDQRTSAEIMKLFYELNRNEGMTIILITHDKDIAADAPRRVVLQDGLIASDES